MLKVTFKIEEGGEVGEAGEGGEREELTAVTGEAPRTEFLSFRSVEEYERAVKKSKEVNLSYKL